MNDTATQAGAAHSEPQVNPDVQSDEEVAIQSNPRNAALEAMAERQEQDRNQELQEALAADPGLASKQAAIEREIDEANAEAGIVHSDEQIPSYANDGAASIQQMHPQESQQSDLPKNLQDDPLADFIIMENGSPMVKAKVNGEERLIPLADAKRQVQIGVAAEVRMQNAAQAEKMIAEREQRVSAGEAALLARIKETQSQPSVPAQPDLTDDELLNEAQDIFNTAFSGTEEDAAKKLAKTLAKIRNSAVARPTQQIDANQIAQQAASMAVGTLSEQARKKDVQKGYQDFKQNYPEIVNDPKLFRLADDMTETIEREHPDWGAAQIMDEAGKRTLSWVKDLSGQTQDTNAPVSGGQNSDAAAVTTQNRLERKQGLVRMPSPAAAAQWHEPEDTGQVEQSPSDAFLELKKARGQPV